MVFSGLKKRLFKTSSVITGGLESALGKGASKEEIMEALEEALITTDIGVETSLEIVEGLKGVKKWDKETLSDNIRARLYEMIKEVEAPLSIPDAPKPYVIMVLGVNGVGKTTTIGKLALWLKDRRKSVVMGAGDTFRAAAVEQLELWGERVGCPVISQSEGTDPGAVAFDTVKSAIAKETDVVLLDTAGRLHNKAHLMEELKKIKRVVEREVEGAPHETLLIVDGSTGQNALDQAKIFNEAVGLTGIIVTKLDGTAKGGIIIPIARELGIPIRFIGVGEGIKDLQEFFARDFAEALI